MTSIVRIKVAMLALTLLLAAGRAALGQTTETLVYRTSGNVTAVTWPADVRTDDAVVSVGGVTTAPPTSTVRRGYLKEMPGCKLAGTQDALGLNFNAFVTCPDGKAMKIEPGPSPGPRVVAEATNLNLTVAHGTCAAPGRCVLELLADTDPLFVAESGGCAESAVRAIDAIVAQVNARYEFDFGITFRISRYEIRLSEEDNPYTFTANSADTEILTEIRDVWMGQGASPAAQAAWNNADLAHLFSGVGHLSLSGAGSLSGVCGARAGFSFHTGADCNRIALAMHEIGHVLGAGHQGSGTLMQPFQPLSCVASWSNAASQITPGLCGQTDEPPAAVAAATCTGGHRTCTLDASASSDDVDVAAVEWSFGDGASGHGETLSHTYASSANYTATARVFDTAGQEDSDSATASPSVFADVPVSHWARAQIEAVYAAGITSGCNTSPLRFCPDGQVQRAHLAVFLLRAMNGPSYVPPVANCAALLFGDVGCSHWARDWIEAAAGAGILSSCGGNLFCPDTVVTRAAIAEPLVRAVSSPGYVPPAPNCSAPVFADVPCTASEARWIERLAALGVTSGCGGGNYCPTSNSGRAGTAVMLARAFGL